MLECIDCLLLYDNKAFLTFLQELDIHPEPKNILA